MSDGREGGRVRLWAGVELLLARKCRWRGTVIGAEPSLARNCRWRETFIGGVTEEARPLPRK